MSQLSFAQARWLFSPVSSFIADYVPQIKLLDKHERWRRVAQILKLSKTARLRLDWLIYYHQGHSAKQTARHFGISRKTFYKWYARFNEDNLYTLHNLEDESRAPQHVRQSELTSQQEDRIIQLRKKRIRYGHEKLARIYERTYGQVISSWHVQKVIEKYRLYYHPKKAARVALKRARSRASPKKRLVELTKLHFWEKRAGYIICLDTITIYWNGLKRHIFTALDKYGKVAFARMYSTKSTINARDFLYRLYYLLDGQVPRVGHDHGSEFKKLFEKACIELAIEQYWSRVKTPKDNAETERFNRTLEDEFLNLGNFHSDPAIFNQRLTEWLIEYNFYRPHFALNYQTPVDYSHLSPMYSSCTSTCRLHVN